MTDEERAAVRTAFRPFMDALAGRSGSVSPEEWAAAVDRVFPPANPSGRFSIFMLEDGPNVTTHIKAPPGMSPADAIAAARRLRLHLGAEIDQAAGCPVHVEAATSDSDVARESGLAAFLNCLRSLHNIDGDQLPELEGYDWISFRDDPPRYFMRCNDTQAAAIWREVEKRQRVTA